MSTAAAALPLHPAVDFLGSQWDAQAAWTVLDTDFGAADTFLDLWTSWRAQAKRPGLLHYVGLLGALDAARLVQALFETESPNLDRSPLASTLAAECYGLGDGFHRILLNDCRVSLTLCVGEMAALLAQQEMQVDTIVSGASAAHWDKWRLKSLARHCRRETALIFDGHNRPDSLLLEAAGFVLQATKPQLVAAHATFLPRWELRNTRRLGALSRQAPGLCAVIGAGIAGASVAHALALRGWTVEVLDRHAQAAGGASGLPAGLVVPHHSGDDSPRSRLSRAGTRLMLQHARRNLVEGKDWRPGGVMELDIPNAPMQAVEAEVHSEVVGISVPNGWAKPMHYDHADGLWHPHAAWIKPSQLIAKWLEHPRIQFHGNSGVQRVEQVGSQWRLHFANERESLTVDAVIFANAVDCAPLLRKLQSTLPDSFAWVPDLNNKLDALQTLYGTLSMGLDSAGQNGTWPEFPVNGHGSFISGVPSEPGTRWFAGSTFQTESSAHADLSAEHTANYRKLRALLPQVANTLAEQFEQQQVQTWQGQRCVTHDRLPLVGPLEDSATPTLWLSAGMGARGLSFSALCAELIAAGMSGEPLPVESNLAKGLSTRRTRKQRR